MKHNYIHIYVIILHITSPIPWGIGNFFEIPQGPPPGWGIFLVPGYGISKLESEIIWWYQECEECFSSFQDAPSPVPRAVISLSITFPKSLVMRSSCRCSCPLVTSSAPKYSLTEPPTKANVSVSSSFLKATYY